MSAWKPVGVVIEGDRIVVAGINPWNYKWAPSSIDAVELPHPTHQDEIHSMNVYEIESGGRTIVFAAGELSASVWGFYVPA